MARGAVEVGADIVGQQAFGFAQQTSAVAERFEEAGLIVRPFAGDGVRISVGEAEAVDRVLSIAASVVEDLPEDHPGRKLA